MLALLLFVLGSTAAVAAEPYVLVSDVDDTVKVTNVRSKHNALLKALFSERAFAGMPELYQEMLGPDSSPDRLHFLSGSPRMIEEEVRETLEPFPAHELTLRRYRQSFKEAFDFKWAELQKSYASSTEKFILIGDDTEADPEVYAVFAAMKRGQVLAIYIRRVAGDKKLPAGSIPFVTAYDIARHELAAGRLTEDQVKAVGESVFAADDKSLLPSFHQCPKRSAPDADLGAKIERRIASICAAR